jgi:1-acyl-sn-glycerol-3-phosphate acyltransferase
VYLHTDSEVRTVTYGDLWNGAARIGAGLASRGVARGDPVAIMLPTGMDYLQAFMGVLAAGGIAVPLYPPARLDRLEEYLQRQSRILANAGAQVLVAMPEAAPVARMLRGAAPCLAEIVTVEALGRAGADPALSLRTRERVRPMIRSPGSSAEGRWAPAFAGATGGEGAPELAGATGGEPDGFALIQYTSGSTGDPKGVLLTHANLLANIRAIAAGVELRPSDVAVSWLPLYHDMGLIGTWLFTMVMGIPLTLMSPLAFLARPERWLWAMHQQRATLSAAPNFAYELCVRKVRDESIQGLDLSAWRCALNGSEPVSAATIDRFVERFGRHGFRRESLMPVYGLAEASVALCFPPPGRAPRIDRVAREPFTREGRATPAAADDGTPVSFVSVGTPLPAHEVRLVGDDGRDVGERVVGHLHFRGPSCMSRYHHNEAATASTVMPGGWIDSGDLAYVSGSEYFIAGRVKDLIIKGGRNLVPQEVEEVAGSVPGIRKGCVAAFGIPDEASGTERLVVLAESRADSPEERVRLEGEVVAAVAAGVGLPPDVVRVVSPGVVPKTPSGKIRRTAARAAFEAGTISGPRRLPLRIRLGLLAGPASRLARAGVRGTWRAIQGTMIVIAWATALLLLGPPIVVLAYVLPAGRPVRRLSRFIARILSGVSGCRTELEGREHLPERGPLVLVANHASYADTPALLATLPVDLSFVAMKELLAWPLVGALVRRGRHPTVDRFHPQQSVAHAAAVEQRLRGGETLLFFAEGGFGPAAGLRPFRLGAFHAAVATGAPVIPVAIRGSRQILRDGDRLPHPGCIHIWIGEPLTAAGTGWRDVVDLRNRAAAAIARHCGEPQLGAAPVQAPAP